MKCVSYTRTMPWKNHTGELTIADQNQRIAEYLAEHKELNLQKRYFIILQNNDYFLILLLIVDK